MEADRATSSGLFFPELLEDVEAVLSSENLAPSGGVDVARKVAAGLLGGLKEELQGIIGERRVNDPLADFSIEELRELARITGDMALSVGHLRNNTIWLPGIEESKAVVSNDGYGVALLRMEDNGLKIVDLQSGDIWTPECKATSAKDPVVGPNGEMLMLVGGEENRWCMLDLKAKSLREIEFAPGDRPEIIGKPIIGPNSEKYILFKCQGRSGGTFLRDLESDDEFRAAPNTKVVFGPNGEKFAFSGQSLPHLVDLKGKQEIAVHAHGISSVNDIFIGPAGEVYASVWASGQGNTFSVLFDLKALSFVRPIFPEGYPEDCYEIARPPVFGKDGRKFIPVRLYLSQQSALLNLDTCEIVQCGSEMVQPVVPPKFSQEGKATVWVDGGEAGLRFLDISEGEMAPCSLEGISYVIDIQPSPFGNYTWVCVETGSEEEGEVSYHLLKLMEEGLQEVPLSLEGHSDCRVIVDANGLICNERGCFSKVFLESGGMHYVDWVLVDYGTGKAAVVDGIKADRVRFTFRVGNQDWYFATVDSQNYLLDVANDRAYPVDADSDWLCARAELVATCNGLYGYYPDGECGPDLLRRWAVDR